MTCGQIGVELEHLQGLLEQFNRENPDIIAELKDYSSVPQQQLGAITQVFLARSSELDVIQVDVVWPGDLGAHLLDLEANGFAGETSDFFPAALANNRVGGKLVAIPWYVDAGLLYYRADLLDKYGKRVPETWDELAATAREIQRKERAGGNTDFWGFVWTGGPGEGLTCFSLELIAGNGGGRILDESGKVTVHNPAAEKALERARSWIGDISPFDVLGFTGSEPVRTWFQTGKVLFMRNWPYAYAMTNRPDSPIAGQFRIAPLPAGDSGTKASCLGGWQLAVSKYSEHPAEAIRLVKFLTSREIQLYRAQAAGYAPSRRSLYEDNSLDVTGNSIFGQLLPVLDTTIQRPSTLAAPVYNSFSQVFFTHVSDILAGKKSAQEGLTQAETALSHLLAEKNSAQ
jgi:trehalose/maltose transport system substrate-binding protein